MARERSFLQMAKKLLQMVQTALPAGIGAGAGAVLVAQGVPPMGVGLATALVTDLLIRARPDLSGPAAGQIATNAVLQATTEDGVDLPAALVAAFVDFFFDRAAFFTVRAMALTSLQSTFGSAPACPDIAGTTATGPFLFRRFGLFPPAGRQGFVSIGGYDTNGRRT